MWLLSLNSGQIGYENKEYICIRCGSKFDPASPKDYFRKSTCVCGELFYPVDEVKWVEPNDGGK